ncbi:MAG: DNA primase [Candidatus Jorgensenbacteria bacterium]|nr:DNA primase [Candidatus Jorgensenbacteria bacterium]
MAKEVDLIKEKLPVLDFIRGYIPLTPAGRNFKGLCPFHPEKTPSFIVSPDKQRWHCFGCAEGGDIITFVMKYENLEFPEALRFLAERAGVQLRALNPQHEREFGVLYDINEEAKNFYVSELYKNTAAYEYIKSRGLNDETLKEFEIGFSPGGEALTLHLIKKGFDVNDATRAGLIYKNSRGLYRDRFEGRIMFPIYNHVGKPVAFTGRVFGAHATEDVPKYVNSPETSVFNKSRVLYGLHKSKLEISRERTVVVVEGQMDLLMAWQCGVRNAVAVSGTGFTEFHLEKLRRIADTVIGSFDNDDAGRKAMERMLDMLNRYDFHVSVISFGEFKDPAEALQKDPTYMKRVIEKAVPAFEFMFERYFNSEKVRKDLALKDRVVNHMLNLMSRLKNPATRNHWVEKLSFASGISMTALDEKLSDILSTASDAKKSSASNSEITKEQFEESRVDMIAKRLVSLSFTNDKLKDMILTNKEYMPQGFVNAIEHPEAESVEMLQMQSSYLFGSTDEKTLQGEYLELIKQLKLEHLKRVQDATRDIIRAAERIGNDEKYDEAMKKMNEISKQMNDLKQ